MGYQLLDGPRSASRTPLMMTLALVIGTIALTLAGVSLYSANRANDRVDDAYIQLSAASSSSAAPVQPVSSLPSAGAGPSKEFAAAAAPDHSAYLRHVAQTTYARASTMLTGHPSCQAAPSHFESCMNTLTTAEHLMAYQIVANKSIDSIIPVIQSTDLNVGHSSPFLVKSDGSITHDGSLSDEVAAHISDVSNCRYTIDSSVCFMHFSHNNTEHMAVLWGNLGNKNTRGFDGSDTALALSAGGGALSGALTGASLGSSIPGVGTAIGGAVGALVGGAGAAMSYAGDHWD